MCSRKHVDLNTVHTPGYTFECNIIWPKILRVLKHVPFQTQNYIQNGIKDILKKLCMYFSIVRWKCGEAGVLLL